MYAIALEDLAEAAAVLLAAMSCMGLTWIGSGTASGCEAGLTYDLIRYGKPPKRLTALGGRDL